MAVKNLPEERKIIGMLEKMVDLGDRRQEWITQIRASGMSEELADEIQAAIAGLEDTGVNRTRYLVDFTKMVKQWRLAAGARQFRKHKEG